MKLRRVESGAGTAAKTGWPGMLNPAVDRRKLLAAAGVGLGAAVLAPSLVRETQAAEGASEPAKVEQIKTICSNCATGCGFTGVVKDGVWVSQEPWFEHPINLGSLCSKGTAAREHVASEKRLRYPMKLEGGKWKRVSWDTAMSEITAKLQDIRAKSGPDALMILGSAHHNNETGYALRKFSAFWGSNNIDHQARICHSTTVAGLGLVWGFGAMTNSMNDIRNSKGIMVIGENVCTSHPIAMLHILTAKEVNKAPLIVVDPRFTQTAGLADHYVRLRSGTDVAFIYGLVNIILKHGWEDKKMLNERTWGFKDLQAELVKYQPETVSDITGVPVADLEMVATLMAKNRPSTVIWAMGGTQHSNGTGVVRAYCILQLVLGNLGVPGGGCNVFRGHDNVQGATDIGVTSDSLPGYYGVAESAFKHWAGVWDVDAEWIKSRFTTVKKKAKQVVDGKEVEVEVEEKLMEKAGLTVARWYEGVLMDAKELGQPTNVKAAIYWGHSSNSESQMDRVKRALEKVELLVDIDPFMTTTALMPERTDGVYMLPAATAYEQSGSVTNSNRGIQWRNRIVKPVFESRPDLDILLDLVKRLGYGKDFMKSKRGPYKELPEDITREWNLGMLSIGMRGQTPERMKRQHEWAQVFDVKTNIAASGPVKGEQWGLPWPCWNNKHPGTAILYRTSLPASKGGGGFRARWGDKAPDGSSMLAAANSAPAGSSIKGGYVAAKDYATDLTGKAIDDALAKGLNPYGNGRARINAWGPNPTATPALPDAVPIHREPIHSPRPDLIAKWPTYDDMKEQFRVPTLFKSLQKPDWVKRYPIILTSGRQVEFEGGGAAERNCWWLVELRPEMYIEIHPKLAADNSIKHGDWVWVYTPEDTDDRPSRIKVKANVTRRVGPDTVFLPFHWAGFFEGKSLADKYPEGNVPYGMGESANTVVNYGYDRITQMQETKTGLCRIEKA